MDSKRQKQVAETIKRNFGPVLYMEGSYIYGDALVTVTNVRMSPDLGIAKIYLSVYNADDKEVVIRLLEQNIPRLRQALAIRIKKQVRRIPFIQLYIDETLDEMYKLNELFDSLNVDKKIAKDQEE